MPALASAIIAVSVALNIVSATWIVMLRRFQTAHRFLASMEGYNRGFEEAMRLHDLIKRATEGR